MDDEVAAVVVFELVVALVELRDRLSPEAPVQLVLENALRVLFYIDVVVHPEQLTSVAVVEFLADTKDSVESVVWVADIDLDEVIQWPLHSAVPLLPRLQCL